MLLSLIIGIFHIISVAADVPRYWRRPSETSLAENLRAVTPIAIHSHNDYTRKKPLFDALSFGCISVEADVWLSSDELYVGHGMTKSGDTLREMYLAPLIEILDGKNVSRAETGGQIPVDENWHGVFDKAPKQTLVLVIDIKSRPQSTLVAISAQLQPLREKNYLSFWHGTHFRYRAITAVVSGSVPYKYLLEHSSVLNPHHRDIFIDAPIAHLDSKKYNYSNSYYASGNFERSIKSREQRGRSSQLSKFQKRRLKTQIRKAHTLGLKVRYWNTPDFMAMPEWRGSLGDAFRGEMEIDILNVDDLEGAVNGDGWVSGAGGGGGGGGYELLGGEA